MHLPSNIEVIETPTGLRVEITIQKDRIEDAEGFDIADFEDRLSGYDSSRGEIEVVWHFTEGNAA